MAIFGVHYNQIVDIEQAVGPFDMGQLIKNGEFAVSLFFTLSGFLLSLPYWNHLLYDSTRPSLRIYILHRLARVMPAYYVCLTGLVLLYGLWRIPSAYPDLLLHYSYLFNYTEFSIFSINAPFWTLAVEVQFYLLLPLIFVFLRLCSDKVALLAVFLLAICAYGLQVVLMHSVKSIIFWPWNSLVTWIRPHGAVLSHSLLAHLPHFLIGVAAAWFVKKELLPKPHQWKYEFVFWFSLLTVMVILSTSLIDLLKIPYGRYGLPVVPFLLTLVIVATPHSKVAVKVLDSLPLHLLGTISYGVYLYHFPILTYLDYGLSGVGYDAAKHWGIFGIAGLVLSLIAASLSYGLIERPVLNFIRKRTASKET